MSQPMPDHHPSFILTPLTAIPPREFESERLRYRGLQPGDGKLLFDLYANDVATCRYMSFKVDGKVETSEAFVRLVADSFVGRHNGRAMFSWVLQLKETGQYIGSAGFEASDDVKVTGGYILNPKFWGAGYAREAWRRLLEVAQSDPGVRRIEANHHPDNPASGKVMRAAGMTCVGTRSKCAVYPNISDEKLDDVTYAWTRA